MMPTSKAQRSHATIVMRPLLLLLLLGQLFLMPITAVSAVAQRPHQRQSAAMATAPSATSAAQRMGRNAAHKQFQAELQAYITQEAKLTATQASRFFPLFFEMKEKEHQLERQRASALRSAVRAASCTEADCQRVITLEGQLADKLTRIHHDYVKRLTALVGPCSMVKIMNADRRFGRQMFKKMAAKQQP